MHTCIHLSIVDTITYFIKYFIIWQMLKGHGKKRFHIRPSYLKKLGICLKGVL